MCQYSLETYRKVDAKTGETYTLDRFPSGTMGFAPAPLKDLGYGEVCAVCIKPGAIVSLDCPDGTCHFGVFSDALTPLWGHHDGIVASGQAVHLQRLDAGTKVTVHLPATDAKDEGPTPSAPEDVDLASSNPSLGERLVAAVRRSVTFVD